MKKLLFGFAFLCAGILTSCSTTQHSLYPPVPKCQLNVENTSHGNLQKENWLCQLNIDPNRWVHCVDPWFLTGKPNLTECALHKACDQAVTKRNVRVPDHFTNIRVAGSFQAQIIGGEDHDSVIILGPNAAARRITVEVNKCTVSIYETKPLSKEPCSSNTTVAPVIVRIKVKQLHSLTNAGYGSIYGRTILSNKLTVNSTGRGTILLAGKMNVVRINQTNSGSVIIYGAVTPNLSIKAIGNGNVNITGRVGIGSIINKGSGAIRIIGADTDSLIIDASGRTRTSVIGYANVRNVNASEFARVYLYWVSAYNTCVRARDNARVGLAGVAQNLNVEINRNTRFWGNYLHADTVYVRTRGISHANVSVNKKLFAEASENSSIYFNGQPTAISKFAYGHSNIIPLCSNTACGQSACNALARKPLCINCGLFYPRYVGRTTGCVITSDVSGAAMGAL